MPSWVKDDKTWAKAKKAVQKNWSDYDEPYAVVAHVYQQMGGKIKGETMPAKCSASDLEAWKSNEALCLPQMAALARAGKEARQGWTFSALREAKVTDAEKRVIRCILITEGPGNQVDKRFYTRAFIEDAAVKYEGARAFLNHATETERQERSEGDVRLQCGYYSNLEVQPTTDPETGKQVAGVFGDLNVDESDAGDEAWSKAQAQIEYAKKFPNSPEVYVGLSINGGGIPDGTVMINGERWTQMVGVGQADSVDVVTRPARGGRFLALAESAKQETDMNKKLRKLLAKLGESKKAFDAEKNEGKKILLEAEMETLQKEITEASVVIKPGAKDDDTDGGDDKDDEDESEQEDEAEEAENESEDESEDEDGEAPVPMAALKKKVPKMPDESDEDHESRIKAIHGIATKGAESRRGQESISGLSAKQLRKLHPTLFNQVAESVRKNLGAQRNDIGSLKGRVRELEAQLAESKVKERILDDTQEARKLLAEAKVPKVYLDIKDLLGLTTEQKRRQIERTLALVEAATGGSGTLPAYRATPGTGATELDAEVTRLLEANK